MIMLYHTGRLSAEQQWQIATVTTAATLLQNVPSVSFCNSLDEWNQLASTTSAVLHASYGMHSCNDLCSMHAS